ncbi:MAG: TMEM175 family protein [Ignavibacteria bacterium]
MENKIKEYTHGTNRMEAFSDGVFAIVVTLLVLELRVPVLPENFSTQDVLKELLRLFPKFFSFAMSFVIVAIFWVNHHQFFHSLEKTDRAMLWYNNLLLFWLSFVPFPTAFIGEHPVSMIPVMLYGAVLFFAGVSFNLMLRHAVKAKLFLKSVSDEVLNQSVKRGVIGPVVYFVSIISAFISVYVSLSIFLLVPVIYFIPQKIVRLEE